MDKNSDKKASLDKSLPKPDTQPTNRNLLHELDNANKEIAEQRVESKKQDIELAVAEKALAHQTKEKEDMADELSGVNTELDNANTELAYEKNEKNKQNKELVVVKKELAFQNAEKADRATELVTANKALVVQDQEKKKQADKLIIVKQAVISQGVEIENLTYQNEMHGLSNRPYFMDALKGYDLEINLPISIIMGDINGLAIINDSIGHLKVDEILMIVVKILRQVVRRSDISICFSNGEFALILPKTDVSNSNEIVKKLKGFASKQKAGSFDVSISCGADTKLSMDKDLDDTVKKALEQLNTDKKIEGTLVENDTIKLIMEMLFEKNNREMKHSSRVSELCERMARKLNFDEGVINRIRITGMLHDIGKIGIDEKILNKFDKLDDHEWKEIKKHPEIGSRILNASNEFVIHAKDVLQHHERIDGKGYPKGIMGEGISLVAKIISIADAYDALISERPYRETMSKKNAIEEIIRCSGTQFDSELVKVFVEMIKEPKSLGGK